MSSLLVYVFYIIAFLLVFLSLFLVTKIKSLHPIISSRKKVDNEDMSYIYSPTAIHKFHTFDNKIHPLYGKQVETITSSKCFLFFKSFFILFFAFLFYIFTMGRIIIIDSYTPYILYAIFIGYSSYYLLHTLSTIVLYKKGFLYKSVFKTKMIPYTDIMDISSYPIKLIKNSKFFISIIDVSLITGEHIYFREKHFAYIKDKFLDLQNNLCWSKILTNNNE